MPKVLRLSAMEFSRALSEGELVGGFEGSAADAADDGGAVAADERVIDGAGADGAPETRHIGGCGWIRRRHFGHSGLSVARCAAGSLDAKVRHKQGECKTKAGPSASLSPAASTPVGMTIQILFCDGKFVGV
jgi:hypothetical protein